ncbi:SRPBCC domain-containing protein [Pseudonocardia sp. GCM10023141]|uniref:SRPBCC domain-containing protein n=1 Tax=Pseudonocardia sp. GCM10023141 TaxID=3252653 RepID=UPI0036183966
MTVKTTTSVNTAVEVDAPITRAFHVFTAEIGTWWDEDKHILTAPLAEMTFQPWVGGNIIDRGTDGSECRWARILAYDPPDRVVFSWDITTRWTIETDPARASEVEIAFTALGPDRTRVVLTHRHLDRHGEGWEQMRDAVGSGWSLDSFAAAVHRTHEPDPTPTWPGDLPTITNDQMHQRLQAAQPYTAIVLRTTDACVRPDVDPIIWEHGRRNMALVDAGLLAVVLPCTDNSGIAGFGVFNASPDITRQILDADPGIRAGIFTYDIHPVRGFPGATLPASD